MFVSFYLVAPSQSSTAQFDGTNEQSSKKVLLQYTEDNTAELNVRVVKARAILAVGMARLGEGEGESCAPA